MDVRGVLMSWETLVIRSAFSFSSFMEVATAALMLSLMLLIACAISKFSPCSFRVSIW